MTPTEKTNLGLKANNHFSNINLDNADILSVESDIYGALSATISTQKWSAYPIAPLAVPVSLTDLLGDMFTGSSREISYQANRINNIYSSLASTNNTLKASLSSVEALLAASLTDVQDLNSQTVNQSQSFYWVSDNFSTTARIDQSQTTALIDTDFGQASLDVSSSTSITNFNIVVDYVNTNGVPGCNLEIINSVSNSDSNTPPQVTLEKSNVTQLSSMFDKDPTTWFEIERNFIPPVQNMSMQSRAWVVGNGQPENVIAVTKNLDWLVTITWPNYVNDGVNGAGVPLAEFIDTSSTSLDTKVRFVFTLVLDNPKQLSYLNILPFSRNGEFINVNSIQILVGTQWFTIAENVALGTNVNTTTLVETILNQSGSQTIGSLYTIPTTQPISQVKFDLSSNPVSVPYGFAHAFQDEEQSYRTQRNYLFFNTVDKWNAWGRIPISSTPTNLSTSSTPSIPGEAVLTAGLSNILNSLIPGGAFGVQHTQTVIADVKGFDIFNGTRAGIGIRDIGLSQLSYVNQSVLQTVKLKFSGNLTNIGLVVSQSVPSTWGVGDWIEYYVSEDGLTWTAIVPTNSTSIQATYKTTNATDTCYLRAVFNGNLDDVNHSAVLRNYAIFGVPA